MKLPKGGLEEYLLLIIGTFLIILILWMLTGCASKQMAINVDYSDGCHFRLEGVSSEQAAKLESDWKMQPPCKVESKSESGSN